MKHLLNVLHFRAEVTGLTQEFSSHVKRAVILLVRALAWLWFLKRGGIRVYNRKNYEGGYVFMANHKDFLDIFVIQLLTKRSLRWVAKKHLFEGTSYLGRLLAWFLKGMGVLSIDRRNDRQSVEVRRAAIEYAKKGEIIVVFPELHRIKRPVIAPIVELAIQIAEKAKVPIVVIGLRKINLNVEGVKKARAEVHISDPINLEPLPGEGRAMEREARKEKLRTLLSELSGYPLSDHWTEEEISRL